MKRLFATSRCALNCGFAGGSFTAAQDDDGWRRKLVLVFFASSGGDLVELTGVELGVEAVPGEKLVVGALLDDVAVRMTRMRSALRIVESRWAMTKLVRPSISRSMASWISASVRVSTELVASSRISMALSASMARAMVSSCFSPCGDIVGFLVQLHLVAAGQGADEVIGVGRFAAAATCLRASRRRARRRCSPRSCPLKSQLSCSTMPKSRRTSRGVISRMSNAVDPDLAAIGIVEAHQQIDHSGLAGAGRTDDGHALTGHDVTPRSP